MPSHLQRTEDLPPATPTDPWTDLREMVDEAIGLQRRAETLLEALVREPSASLARRGGPIMSRFVALRRELPRSSDPAVRRYAEIVDSILEHHAELLSAVLERLSTDGHGDHEPPTDGLGPPARWLETVQIRLAGQKELPVA